MKSPRLIYLITRIHGLRMHLLKPDNIRSLVEASNLEQVVERLLAAEYAKDIYQPHVQKLHASEHEEIFLKKMVSRFFFVSSISPKKVKEFVLAYARRFEVENIKRVIRAKHAGEKVGQLIPLTREQTLVNFKALLEAEDLSRVVKLLSETAYAPLAGSLPLYTEHGTTLVLESHLDKIYYEGVKLAAKKLKNKEIKHLIGVEIDTRNLLTIFAMKIRKLKPKLIEELIIQGGTLTKRRLAPMAQAGTEEIQSFLGGTPYAKSVGDAVEALRKKMGVDRAEAALFTPFYKEIKSMGKKSLGLPYVATYLIQSETEAKNLIAITMAKQLKLSASLLRDIVLI